MKTWVLVTNGEYARVFELANPREQPKEIYFDQGYKPDYQGVVAISGSMRESVKSGNAVLDSDVGLLSFIQVICVNLEQAWNEKRFSRLALIAPEEVLNEFMDCLGARVRESLVIESAANLMNAGPAVIRASLPL